MQGFRVVCTACALVVAVGWPRAQQAPAAVPWRFVVSGDSRNCGDVVMPAIARTAIDAQAAFFWHLGDLRWITDVDNDIQSQPAQLAKKMSWSKYLSIAWDDFIDQQLKPFGSMPFFLGIGNHDVIRPVTREDFVKKFANWLDTPVLREQRLRDNPKDTKPHTYYRWLDRGVSFYFLDNASLEQFDFAQLRWFERALASDSADPGVLAIVVGMHKPLPDGFSGLHSMSESETGIESGRRVYADLLKAQNAAHKLVYVLASHQHMYMADAHATPYWKQHGGVLPGWVVGTAGAPRYPLPVPSPPVAKTNVYGALVATVSPAGEISFEWHEITEPDVPAAVLQTYGQAFVHWCFAGNRVQ
jgi:hypothetical protein